MNRDPHSTTIFSGWRIAWGPHREALLELQALLSAPHPLQAMVAPDGQEAVAVRVLIDFPRAIEATRTSRWISMAHAANKEARRRIAADPGYLDDQGAPQSALVYYDFLERLAPFLGNMARDEPQLVNVAHYVAQKILELIVCTIISTGSAPSLGWSYFKVLRLGYLPLRWYGSWPDGFCLAYCPPGSPHAVPPLAFRPTIEQLAAGGIGPLGRTPLRPWFLDLLPGTVPIIDPQSWGELAAAKDPAAAVIAHLGDLCETTECRDMLARIARAVKSITVEDGCLRFNLEAGTNGVRQALICAPPYRGPYQGLPLSLAAVLGRHNGMKLVLESEDLEWYPYAAGRFQLAWETCWQADLQDPDELFLVPPLTPMSDDDGVWIVHPLHRRANGEPALIWMRYDFNSFGKPLPLSAGGIFIRWIVCGLFGQIEAAEAGIIDQIRGSL